MLHEKLLDMRLSELKTGESATILKVLGHGGFRRRIMEMGFVRGQRVEVILNAPLKDPIQYRIMGYDVSLRRSEAEMIQVFSDSEAHELLKAPERHASVEAVPGDDAIDELVRTRSHTICVALVGNPNSGKTSLFNAISGGHEHVGNYSGVTVGAKSGVRCYRGYRFQITDLPGTYALSAYTPEELFVRAHIAEETPDVIINSVVASNLERNLYLTTELIDINPRMVVALNMFDELTSSGAQLDYESLGRMLGVPMVPVEARNGKGIEALLDTIIAVYENQDERVRHIHIGQGSVIEEGLRRLNGDMNEHHGQLPKTFPPRYFAMKMLEGDRQVNEQLRRCERYPVWAETAAREAERITKALGEDVETAFANQKYGFISGALKETYTPGRREEATTTALIDSFVTHKLWGFPIFFFLMWLMFWCTFYLGAYPQGWIDTLVGWVGRGVDALLPPGALRDLLADGVIGGVGAVIVFLPNIMVLYLFISFMEDSGYLARAAFIMDRVMHRIGLHGKSFIPLVMGFGCNVPAVMACRTIESRSSRLITILITPFMSCSARLPIYILIAGTFFTAHAGWVMTGLYVLGVAVAVVTARLLRRFLFRADETPFVMELPPLSLADVENHADAHVGQVRAVPAQDGRDDSDSVGHRMVSELLSPHGGERRRNRALRKFLPGPYRQGLRTRFRADRHELESGRGAVIGRGGQRNRSQHLRSALFGKRRPGRRSGYPAAAAEGERRFPDRHGAGVSGVHFAVLPVHRHRDGHRRRGGMALGAGRGGL